MSRVRQTRSHKGRRPHLVAKSIEAVDDERIVFIRWDSSGEAHRAGDLALKRHQQRVSTSTATQRVHGEAAIRQGLEGQGKLAQAERRVRYSI